MGQLGITVHTGETALWTKDTANTIVKLSAGGSATFYNTANLGLANGPANHPGGNIIPASGELTYQEEVNLWFQQCFEQLDSVIPITFGSMPASGRYVGDLHVDYDDKLHVWNGGAWIEISGGGGVEIWEGAGQPAPGSGYDLWMDTGNGVLMVKLQDGTWAPCSPAAAEAIPPGDGTINLVGGDGIDVSGDIPTANQKDESATVFKVDVGDGIAIDGGKVVLDPDFYFPEAPDDGQVYGRNGKEEQWDVIVTDGSKIWVVEAGEASPLPADGVKAGDLMYRPAEDRLYVFRVFENTGDLTWMQVLADSGGGPTPPVDGAIQTITVNKPLTKTGPATDPVLGIDLSDVEDRLDALEAGGGGGTDTDLADRVTALESELATLKTQMAKVLQAGDVIKGAMTTPDSGPDDAAFNGNIQIQL